VPRITRAPHRGMNGRCITAAGAARGSAGWKDERTSNRTCRAIYARSAFLRNRRPGAEVAEGAEGEGGSSRIIRSARLGGKRVERVPNGKRRRVGLLDNELNARGLMSVHAPSRDKRTRRFVWGESISAAAAAAALSR
jgi:hypothetical protein